MVRTNGCFDNGDFTDIFSRAWMKQAIDALKEDGTMQDVLIPFVSPRVVEPKVRRGTFLLPSR
jgi:hypothetical protein